MLRSKMNCQGAISNLNCNIEQLYLIPRFCEVPKTIHNHLYRFIHRWIHNRNDQAYNEWHQCLQIPRFHVCLVHVDVQDQYEEAVVHESNGCCPLCEAVPPEVDYVLHHFGVKHVNLLHLGQQP